MKAAPRKAAPKEVRAGGPLGGQAAELRGLEEGGGPGPPEASSVARVVQGTPRVSHPTFCRPASQTVGLPGSAGIQGVGGGRTVHLRAPRAPGSEGAAPQLGW